MSQPTTLTRGDDLVAHPEANLAWFGAHLQRFGGLDHPVLPLFRDLTTELRGVTAETSCKIEGDRLHGTRLHLLSVDTGGHTRRLDRVLAHLDAVAALPGVTLDRTPLDRVLGGDFDRSCLVSVFTGLDLRASLADSRVKVWLGLYRAPVQIERVLAMHGPAAGVEELVVQQRLLVGFDHFLDGRSSLKIYPDFRHRELRRRPELRDALSALLGPRAMSLVDATHWVHVSYDAARNTPLLHLHTAEPDDFFHRFVDNETARAVHRFYQGQRLRNVCVSVGDDELRGGGPLQRLNLYYKR